MRPLLSICITQKPYSYESGLPACLARHGLCQYCSLGFQLFGFNGELKTGLLILSKSRPDIVANGWSTSWAAYTLVWFRFKLSREGFEIWERPSEFLTLSICTLLSWYNTEPQLPEASAMAIEDRGPQIVAVGILFLVLLWIAVILRCYVRLFMTK